MKKIIELALAMTLLLSLAAYQNHASESDKITFGASHVFQ